MEFIPKMSIFRPDWGWTEEERETSLCSFSCNYIKYKRVRKSVNSLQSVIRGIGLMCRLTLKTSNMIRMIYFHVNLRSLPLFMTFKNLSSVFHLEYIWELWFDRSTPFCHSCFTSWLCLTCVFVPDWSYKTYFCSLLFCDVLLWWKYLYLYILIHVLSFLCNLLTNLFNMNTLWVNF